MARRLNNKSTKLTKDNALTVSPWALSGTEVEQLRRKFAKQANQRLVRLERQRASTGERLSDIGIAQYAYEQIKTIKASEGKKTTGKLRFKESSRELNDQNARMELYILQNFLQDVTSKAGTAAKFVSKTQKTFEERGISVGSYKSFYNFLNSSAFAQLQAEGLNSNDIVELYNKAHESGKSFKIINKAIDDYMKSLDENETQPATIKDLAKTLGVNTI